MNGDQLILWLSYLVLAAFIGMLISGIITGGFHPVFDLLGITAGVVSILWLGRNV